MCKISNISDTRDEPSLGLVSYGRVICVTAPPINALIACHHKRVAEASDQDRDTRYARGGSPCDYSIVIVSWSRGGQSRFRLLRLSTADLLLGEKKSLALCSFQQWFGLKSLFKYNQSFRD
jgi:hypothetical protein